MRSPSAASYHFTPFSTVGPSTLSLRPPGCAVVLSVIVTALLLSRKTLLQANYNVMSPAAHFVTAETEGRFQEPSTVFRCPVSAGPPASAVAAASGSSAARRFR